MRVIVHGGAGGSPDEPEPRQATLDEAADVGAAETDPVDAVEAAIRVLEADTRFNAGTGGAVQSDGVIRTDAGVMTSDREAGAAASMPGVEAAVSVARAVMEDTPHVQLAGVHAVDFAADVGVDVECDLWSDDTQERWDDLDNHPDGSPTDHLDWIRDKFGETDPGGREDGSSDDEAGYEKDHDTVGAVAFDRETLAAATSTGGRWLALAGRVGDVPQIGSGFYASPAGAASATGAGEDIAKTTLTRRAVRHLENGLGAQAAADRAIEEFGELTGSSAGVIVLDSDGEYGEAFNSEAMQTARARTQ
ncbi:isoaspartyl peptidase/L-asparaginase [Halobacterium jilantaiense]|uniref:Plant-type L-asparaginase n=1 Tax=Halobacterium jilantaiense TaxID=355548 RepID=A0A1I0QIM8_9EURY|nr:isoaspartyl peptidase/L-asparaginase [Halobacterium jilantaiense]SEW26812.1 asparaginase [Halobacterium jilantaiense]